MTDGAETDVVGLLPKLTDVPMEQVLSLHPPALAATMKRLLERGDEEVVAAFTNFAPHPDTEP